jgi:hypothetical protein
VITFSTQMAAPRPSRMIAVTPWAASRMSYATAAQPAPRWGMVQHLKDLAELKDQGILTEDGKRERPGQAYLASRPISWTRWTAWPREVAPSLR